MTITNKKMNVYQYYKKIPSKYSFKVSTILFDNKVKIKWEHDNLMKRERKNWSLITSQSNVEQIRKKINF